MKNLMLAEPSTIALFGLGVILLFLLTTGAIIVLIVYFFHKSRTGPSASAAPVPPPPVFPKTEVMPRKCPQCGAALQPDAPEGLCPACLLQRGFGTEGGAKSSQTSFEPPSFSELAQMFPHLEILECLGRGGMGAVYKARQPRLDRFVALKIIAPEKQKDLQFAERFEREARALARLNHPNIVTVFDFGEVQGRFYLLMEFVDGLTLRQLLQTGKLSPAEALSIVPKICEALQFAHEQGIVHRDIKPENILLDKQGRVKIADFGIAKIVDLERKDLSLTGEKDVMGTPHYMAPEQLEKPQTVDHRADIYSLGVVFYEMLTGELPLGKFAPPSQKVRVDVRLDEVVLHALEKEPARRYQHASQVKTAVEGITGSPAEFAAAPGTAGSSAPPAFPVTAAGNASDKTILPAFLLAFFFGVFGAHRFYVGKYVTACLQLLGLGSCILWIVLCAAGAPQPLVGLVLAGSICGCLAWATIDWLLLVCKAFKDGKGITMTHWVQPDAGTAKPAAQTIAGAATNPSQTTVPKPGDGSGMIITAPAVALMVAGLWKLLSAVVSGLFLLPGGTRWLNEMVGGNFPGGWGWLGFLSLALFKVVPGLLILFGGHQMLERWSYAWSVAAGIIGIIACSLISLPIGIWALIVLARDDVKAAFDTAPPAGQSGRAGHRAAVIAGWIVLIFLLLTVAGAMTLALIPGARSVIGLGHSKLLAELASDSPAMSPAQLQQAGIVQGADGEFKKHSTESFPLDANGRFSIHNIDGQIEIHGWNSNAVVLKILIHGKTATAVDAVKINVDSQPDHADVRTDLGDHLDNGWTWLRLLGRDKAAVDYVVQVPQRAQLTGVSSVDGRVTIDGVAGPITATTVDGAMNIKNAADDLNLSAVDGSISVSMDALGGEQSVSLHTVDGSVTLAAPEDADAHFSVHTIDGGVTSDFADLQPMEEVAGHRLKGKLGQGRAGVTVETVDGAVKILKSRPLNVKAAKPPVSSQLFYEWHGTGWVAAINHDFRIDSPAVSSAKKWLKLVDAGNYSESWKETASFVQDKKREADWINLLNTNRAPLGKLLSRDLIASIPLTFTNGVPTSPAISDPITGSALEAPDGPYMFVQFQSSFAAKQNTKEEVTLGLDKDGQWRAIGYFIK